MTERIDHAAEAHYLTRYALGPEPGSPEVAALYLAEAQVHATLALVEQQRIANLLTYLALPIEVHGRESEAWSEINEGLGQGVE